MPGAYEPATIQLFERRYIRKAGNYDKKTPSAGENREVVTTSSLRALSFQNNFPLEIEGNIIPDYLKNYRHKEK